MTTRRVLVGVVSFTLSLIALMALTARTPTRTAAGPRRQAAPSSTVLGTTFTYQGQLKAGDTPVDGDCQMALRLFDDSDAGMQVGNAITQTVPIAAGLFTIDLDFGSGVFAGESRWLEIAVQCRGDAGYTTFDRQALRATPQALYAMGAPWSGLSGIPDGFADGVDDVATEVHWDNLTAVPPDLADGDDDTIYSPGTGLVLIGTEFGITTTYRLPQGCANGQIAAWNGTAWLCEDADYWSLTGNGGILPGTHFLGTTDRVSLTLSVSGSVALRLEPEAVSPNLLGGHGSNTVTPGVRGAIIGGGGDGTSPNRVTDDFGTVGGGANNQSGDDDGATSDAPYATVCGGQDNQASGQYATVPGGRYNSAKGTYSFAAGHRAKAEHQGTFVWADSTDVAFSTTLEDQFRVRATGGVYFFTNANLTSGVYLAPNGNSWIPIGTLGPIEDVDRVDRQSSVEDANGVALAAIQGLSQFSKEQATRIAEGEAENARLLERIGGLEARLTALEAADVARSSQSGLPDGWLLVCGLILVTGVSVQRWRPGGGR